MSPAPIALFVYARPHHTRMALEALRQNRLAPLSDLVVFCDGPSGARDSLAVAQVRAVVRAVDGFRTLRVVERPRHLGLADSIVSGVTEVVEAAGQVVVIEDDLVTSPAFLDFMNDGLDRFRADNRVASIHGYLPLLDEPMPEAFFLRGADCWGWATWQRGWSLFQPDGRRLLRELRSRRLVDEFDFGGSYPYTRMLRDQVKRRNDSWAIRWYASAFLAGALTLHPGRSLVRNIGLDGSGRHCTSEPSVHLPLSASPPSLNAVTPVESTRARRAFERYYRQGRGAWLRRTLRRARSLLGIE